MPLLPYEEFEKYMSLIKAMYKFDTELNKLCDKYTTDVTIDNFCYDECTLWFPSLNLSLCIELLEKLMHNNLETIQYFVYELDFGEKWKPGMVPDKEGNDVKLQTIEELYNLLLKEVEEENK